MGKYAPKILLVSTSEPRARKVQRIKCRILARETILSEKPRRRSFKHLQLSLLSFSLKNLVHYRAKKENAQAGPNNSHETDRRNLCSVFLDCRRFSIATVV